MVVVVPHVVLFRDGSRGKIRKKTFEEKIPEAVISLPAEEPDLIINYNIKYRMGKELEEEEE